MALILAATVAMLVANSPFGPGYAALRDLPLGPLTVRGWIDDAGMALFFLLVGLEIKRAFVSGELAHRSARTLPVVAAVAGMTVPALVYLAIAGAVPGLARGWAIPVATDIAFAMAMLALLGRRVPASLKLLLVAIAIVDDLGAVAIIALFYTAHVDAAALAAAAGLVAVLAALNRRGTTALLPYLAVGIGLWIAIHHAGIHPTLAGVATALAIPAGDAQAGPLHRLELRLAPWVGFLVVPLFGLANAGVDLRGVAVADLLAPLPLGIASGLFLGKQAGVFLGLRLTVAAGLGAPPAGADWRQVWGMATLCGIGFTMSLFVGDLAFADPATMDRVRVGVLGGSLLSALAGYLLLRGRTAAD